MNYRTIQLFGKVAMTFLFGALLTIQIVAQIDSTETDSSETAPPQELSYIEMIEFDDISELSLEDLMNIQLTTGSFLELDFKSSPVSMTLITEGMIASSGARHLSEVLEIYTPGFQYMVNKWNGIIWGMRGVAADRNTKIIFLVNGHKMNHESRDGAMSELDLGMLGDIERIEVLRGPAGLVYGSGSIAGVVNIVTKQYNEDVVKVNTALRSWNNETTGGQFEATFHKQINDDASITVATGYRESQGTGIGTGTIWGKAGWPYPAWDGDNAPSYGVSNASSTWSTPGNYRASVDFKFKEFRLYTRSTHQVSNGGGYFVHDLWPDIFGNPDSTASPVYFDGENRTYDSFYGQIETFNTNRRQYVIDNVTTQLSYKLDIGANTLLLNAGMDNVSNKIQRENRREYDFLAPEEGNRFVEETFGEDRYNFGATYQIKTISKLQAAVGYQFRLMDIGDDMGGNNSQGEKGTHPIVSDVIYLNHAFFGEGLYDLHENVKLNLGARYDLHTRTIEHGGVFSPKLALITTPHENHVIKLIYQTSANNGSADNYDFNRNNFKDDGTVTVGDEYRYEEPTRVPGDNPVILPPVTEELLHQLKPEKASSLELITVHEFGSNLIVSPAVSYNTIKDLFVWSQDLFRVMNGGQYNFVNVDLEAKYSSEKLGFGINHTIQRVVNTDVDFELEFQIPAFEGYDSTLVDGIMNYSPTIAKMQNGEDSILTKSLKPVETISYDGKNFTNFATTTKLYVDYSPTKWITFHSDARIFWGLKGRSEIHELDDRFPYLGADQKAIVKWNIGVHVKAGDNLKVSVLVYDLLASADNPIHSLRWQQLYETSNTALYGADFRSMGINIEYKF